MPCFIKLTEANVTEKRYINMDTVTDMKRFKDKETGIYFNFVIENDYSMIKVKETPEDIIALINKQL